MKKKTERNDAMCDVCGEVAEEGVYTDGAYQICDPCFQDWFADDADPEIEGVQ